MNTSGNKSKNTLKNTLKSTSRRSRIILPLGVDRDRVCAIGAGAGCP